MALFKFCKSITENQPIDVYNHGLMERSFTYIDDIVEGVVKVLSKPATPDETFLGNNSSIATSSAPYRIFNIGSSRRYPLMEYIGALKGH